MIIPAILAFLAVSTPPQCNIPFTFSASGQSSQPLNNIFSTCGTWYISYSAYNVTGLSLNAQFAADAGGAPGTYGVLIGPLSTTPYASAKTTGYAPWINVAQTGTFGPGGIVVGSLIGWTSSATAGSVTPGLTWNAITTTWNSEAGTWGNP